MALFVYAHFIIRFFGRRKKNSGHDDNVVRAESPTSPPTRVLHIPICILIYISTAAKATFILPFSLPYNRCR